MREDVRLSLLHAILQLAMGWTNSHLHQFMVGRVRYTDMKAIDDVFSDEEPDRDEEKFTLSDLFAEGEAPLPIVLGVPMPARRRTAVAPPATRSSARFLKNLTTRNTSPRANGLAAGLTLRRLMKLESTPAWLT